MVAGYNIFNCLRILGRMTSATLLEISLVGGLLLMFVGGLADIGLVLTRPLPLPELCADSMLSAAARRVISVGGGGAPTSGDRRWRQLKVGGVRRR